MKRVVILLGLAAGLLAVAMLLLTMGGDDERRERRTSGVEGDRTRIAEGAGETGDATTKGGKDAEGRAIDNDPNRIPGPDVVVTGRVEYDGVPVAGAKVQLLRAYPADPRLQLSWSDPRRRTQAPDPLAEIEADENGQFTLSAARRSRIVVRAWGEKTSTGTAQLFVPQQGNPEEVVVKVGPAFEITGIVVNEAGDPVPGVKLTSSSSAWRTYPFLQETESGPEGRFGFASLGRGRHNLLIEKEGYPTLQRYYAVPEAKELRVELVVGGAITGTVKTDKGEPVAGARLILSTGDRSRNAYGSVDVTTDESGNYSIPMAAPGNVNTAILEHADWGRRESQRGEILLPRDKIPAGKSLTWDIVLTHGVTVRGVVVDKESQLPVANARLTFMRSTSGNRQMQASRYGATDENGRFEVHHILEGTYAIDVRAPKHMRAISQWIQPNQRTANDFFADGVNNPDDLRVEVGGSARVEGHIKAEGMDSFRNTWIQIPELQNAVNAQADSTGFFVFENVPVGEPLKLKTWMPAAESEPFTPEQGETKVVDLVAEGAPQFTGTVVGSNGDPVVGAYVKASVAGNARNEFRQILSNSGWGSSRTDAEGRFAIRLQEWQLRQAANQKWKIAAVSYEYPLQVTENVGVPKDGTSVEVQITLQAGGTISGIVEFEGRGPLANARVAVSPKAVDKNAARNDLRVGRYAYTDLAGRFSMDGIGEGEWNVTTTHADGKAEPQVATAGTGDVRLTIKPTLALSGIVVDEDGKPLAQVRVAAIISQGQKEQKRGATSDQSGRFRIAQLEPGDYELEATPGRQQNMYYGGGGQANAGFKKTRTRAYPAGTETIVIEVEPGNKITGRVLDSSGKGIGGAGVIAMPTKVAAQKPGQPYRQAPNQPTTFTNGRGEFTIKGVGDQGDYEVVAIARDYLISSTKATVGETDVIVNLSEGSTIEGKLLAPDGKPIGGQWVTLQAKDPEVQKKFQDWWRRAGNSWNNIGGWQASSSSTKPDGTFKMTGLFPGKYTVSVYTQRGVVPNTELHTDSGTTTIRLTEGMSVSGRVLDEDGNVPVVTNGMIYINANAGGQWKSAQADADGNFELKGLAPGAVKLQVWAGNTYVSTTYDAQAGDTGIQITLKKRPPPQPK